MKKKCLTTIFLAICSFTFSQEMGKLYKYVMEDNYHTLLTQGLISKSDTVYFFSSGCTDFDECVFDYKIDIKNPLIQIKIPKVGPKDECEDGYMFFAPELENRYIVISYIGYGICYDEELNRTAFCYGGLYSYYFTYSIKYKKYVFVKKKSYIP